MVTCMLIISWWLSFVSTIILPLGVNGACDYPAIFAFGDSLTDTGNSIRTNPLFINSIVPPYGETYFHRPAQRYNDGRLVIDLIARVMGLPFLHPYLANREDGIDFSNGVNYAVAGGTVESFQDLLQQGGVTTLTMDALTSKQIPWHLHVKSLASDASYEGIKLPSPKSFSKGLYFIWIGGNDYGTIAISSNFHFGRNSTSYHYSNVKELHMVPKVVNGIISSIETLYKNEARNFLILNVGPTGCSPLFYDYLNGTPDNFGCLVELNEVAEAHNQMLSTTLESLKNKYVDIHITYADFYSVYKDILVDPSAYGFKNTLDACCGAGKRGRRQFKLLSICNPITYKCPNPSNYVVWDGIHNTDAFNEYVVRRLIGGSHITPDDALSCASKSWDQ